MALKLSQLDGTSGFRIDRAGTYEGEGFSATGAGDINGDGIEDLILGVPGFSVYTDENYYFGESYVVFGSTEDFGASLELTTLDGVDGSHLAGSGPGGRAGDINGDGFDDLIIGVPYANASYIVFGVSAGFGASFDLTTIDGTDGFRVVGAGSGTGVGDINGDGIGDLFAGSHVAFGSSAGFPPILDLSSLDGTNGFRVDGDGFSAAGAGDINGDGIDDLLVGSSLESPDGRTYAGASYVVFGSAAGFASNIDLGLLDGTNGFRLDGIDAYDESGWSVAGAGDVNGDGIDDLIIGAPWAEPGGESYVVFGSAAPFVASFDLAALDGTNGFRLVGTGASGFSVSGAGDINRDGIDDLIIGAPNVPASYVVFGSSSGFAASLDLAALDGTNGIRLDGAGGMVGAGDVNGDGIDDLIGVGGEVSGYVVFGSERLGAANDAPVAANDVLSVGSFDVFDLAGTNSAGADHDPNFDTLTITAIDGTPVIAGDSVTLASGFRVTLLGAAEVRFDAPGVAIGTSISQSFAYEISDGRGGHDTASVSVDYVQNAMALATLDGTNGFRLDGIDAHDLSGYSVAGAGDVNGDGIDDVIIGARGADDYAGASYVVFGSSVGFGASLDLAVLDGTNGFRLGGIDGASGRSVAGAGDVNGDGIDDLIIGAPFADPGGESYVVFGSAAGFGASLDLASLDGTDGFRLDGSSPYTTSGFSVSGAGDVNGDGVDDLLIGAPALRFITPGASFVVFGSSAGFAASLDLSALDGANGFRLNGIERFSGFSVAGAGDVNGDGFDDLIIGSPGGSPHLGSPSYDVGASFVVYGSAAGFGASLDIGALDGMNGFRLDGVGAGDLSGFSVAGAGDINGDAIDDLIIGAPDTDAGAGASYVVFGSTAGVAANLDLSALDGTNGFRLDGVDAFYLSGLSVAGAGDVNGDGIDDIVIGAPGFPISFPGESYVVFGSTEGFGASLDLSTLDGRNGFRLDGIEAKQSSTGDDSGWSVGGAGDINGDGIDDLIIGAPYADPDGKLWGGESYVVFGSRQFGGPNEVPVAADDVLQSGSFDRFDLAADNGSGVDYDPDSYDLRIVAIDGTAVTPGATVMLASGLRVTSLGATEVQFDAPGVEPGTTLTESFEYVVSDRRGGSDTATVVVDYSQNAINLADLDGALDLGHLDGTVGFRLVGVDGGDNSGVSVAGAGDINGDGVDDLIIGADGASKSYVVFGTAAGFSASLDLAALDGTNGFRLDGGGDQTGYSVAGAGDINGDGIDDFIVGAPGADFGPWPYVGGGVSYVVFGTAKGFGATIGLDALDGSNGFRLNGPLSFKTPAAYSGQSVAGAGDINGDGIDDLIIGAPGHSATYVVFGSATGFEASIDLGTLDGANGFRLHGSEDSGSGSSVAGAGDVNGDGLDDLIIGAGDTSYVVFGSTAGFDSNLELPSLDGTNGFRLDGGDSVAGAGDVNGDGIPDLVVGGEGSSYVVFGSAAGFAATLDLGTLDGSNGFRLDGGDSVAGAGDIDGDGVDDLIIGAGDTSYVVFGSATGSAAVLDLATFDGSDGFRLDAGGAVAGAGDVNGDGVDDMIVGVPSADPGGRTDAGESYVVFGSRQLGGANDGPLAADDVLSLAPFDTVDLAADNGAGSDRDPDFDALTIVSVNGAPVAPGDSVVLPWVTFLGGTELQVGDPGLQPGVKVSGSFDYVISDGQGGVDTATVSFDFHQDSIALTGLDGSNGFRLLGGGSAVASAGDVNGDGIGDVIASDSGFGVHVIFGSGAGFGPNFDPSTLDGENGFHLEGMDGGTTGQYGVRLSVAGAGDVNGDGIDDLIVGTPYADGDSLNDTGESYVVVGSTEGFQVAIDLSALDGVNGFRLEGSDDGDNSGVSVAGAGDVNGDGIDDLIIGAPGADPGRKGSAGESYVVFGSRLGFEPTFDLSALYGANGFRLDGSEVDAQSGNSVAGAGDVNGDGIDDLIVGAYGAGPYAGSGASYVVFGTRSGFMPRIDLATLDGSNGFRINGIDADDQSGFSVAGAGDVNGDGFDDLIVGAPKADPDGRSPARGESYVVFGSSAGFSATFELASLDGSDGFRLDGISGDDLSGHSVAAAGDFNGDGIDDLIVGAPDADPDGRSSAGESYVVFGSSAGFAATFELASLDGSNGLRLDGIGGYDLSGRSVAAAGDVNSDGIDDLIVGSPGAYGGAGASYIVFGFRSPETGATMASVAANSDDAEQWSGKAHVNLTSKDLDIGEGCKLVGLRFTGLDVPDGATITGAHVEFQARTSGGCPSEITVAVEDTTDAAAFGRGANSISQRDYLSQTTDWTTERWVKGGVYQTADLAASIAALVGDDGLDPDDALVFRFAGMGERTAWSFDGKGEAAKLVIEYAGGGPAPSVPLELLGNQMPGSADPTDGLADQVDLQPDDFRFLHATEDRPNVDLSSDYLLV